MAHTPIRIGDLLPPGEFVDHQGNPWSPAAHRGRAVGLVFHRHLA